jgi:biopolymer transport protein ExbB/TolQ
METQNYKRTLAGSVGAGVGALVGSGRTYFILEHKTTSKYHQAGESQKIIVDEVELGRDASCQVRFDEEFETVSRKHAAIVREGENFKLIHLSQSNPTLVNGKPINGSYYLQTGDEIQLSVGGPRIGFIVPQGRQALTSSIGLTERMSLFRQQALRPYKTAITVMAIVLILAIVGLGTWNYLLHSDNVEIAGKLDETQEQLAEAQRQLDDTGREMSELANQKNGLENDLQQLQQQVANGEIAQEQAQNRANELNARLNQVTNQLNATSQRNSELSARVSNLTSQVQEQTAQNNARSTAAEERNTATAAAATAGASTYTSNANGATNSTTAVASNGSDNLRDYYDHIYTMKIDKIEVEYNGNKFDPGISVSDIICGTGFMLDNGTFVTDRQNVEPWIYSNTEWKEPWRKLLAIYKSVPGCRVIIHYRAYSTLGTGKPLTFTNTDFNQDTRLDVQRSEVEVERALRVQLKDQGIRIDYTSHHRVSVSTIVPSATSFAYIRGLGARGTGMPYDLSAGSNLPGGTEVHMVGYAGYANIHNLTPAHFNDHTNIADTKYRCIILQNRVSERGYYGSPAFIQKDGKYVVIGIMVGSVEGKDRLVPINNIF